MSITRAYGINRACCHRTSAVRASTPATAIMSAVPESTAAFVEIRLER
ncbi:hypothetical protein [Actinoallomurus acaciae]|uniref:Uncharacterized protein n=1 Tax=Actinoallomurus acaciae TaxID=502577 RepID=A0ABV5Y7Y0_9ACTN